MIKNTISPFPMSLSQLSLTTSELYLRRKANSRKNSRENSPQCSLETLPLDNDGGVYEELEEWGEPPLLPPRNLPNVYVEQNNEIQKTVESGYLHELTMRNVTGFFFHNHNLIYFCYRSVTGMSLDHMFCSRCREGFEAHEKIVNSNGELWHPQCFVCAQCFRPFPEGIFYEFEGRKYCEHDFHVLFAPCCGKCGEFVIGRVIKAMNANWHPGCFRCEECNNELADAGFIKCQGRALCHTCNAHVKAGALGKHICHQCHGVIDDKPLRFRGEVYHPYHFNCTACGIELNSDAREVRSRPGYAANEMNELYCLRCHDKMGIPICGACRRPIEERVVTALGKHWHVEHFVCAKCEKPFLGHRHYEKKGMAYCETHYHQLFGNLCFVCNQVIAGDVFTALNKAWCVHHFACAFCDQKMNQKTKFFEFDLKPACKKCYEKFPQELKKRMRRMYDLNPKRLPAS